MKSTSEKLFLDLLTMSAPSGEERTPDASAQVERAALGYASAASAAHSWVFRACIAEAAASEALGLTRGRLHPRVARPLWAVPRKVYVGRNLRTVRICKLRLTVRILVVSNLQFVDSAQDLPNLQIGFTQIHICKLCDPSL